MCCLDQFALRPGIRRYRRRSPKIRVDARTALSLCTRGSLEYSTTYHQLAFSSGPPGRETWGEYAARANNRGRAGRMNAFVPKGLFSWLLSGIAAKMDMGAT